MMYDELFKSFYIIIRSEMSSTQLYLENSRFLIHRACALITGNR